MYTKLLYEDENYKFYSIQSSPYGCKILIKDASDNPIQVNGLETKDYVNKVFNIRVSKGKSEPYTYYKITYESDTMIQEIVIEDVGILKLVYTEGYVPKKSKSLQIKTTKGGIKVRRPY